MIEGVEIRRALDGGWEVRIPIRAEHVTVGREIAVVERVRVGLRRVDDVARIETRMAHERLRVETSGDVEATRRIEPEEGRHASPR
jgi:uncharacterized protein (TIGR02271 family)